MRIESTNVYVGPNLFARFPVIRHIIDLGELEHWPTARLGDAFIEPLLETLPGLHEHGCSYKEPGGFVRRLRDDEGTWMGHIMEHVAIELQNVAGSPVTYGRTRTIDGQPGHYNMVFEYKDEAVGLESGKLAIKLLLSLLPDEIEVEGRPEADWNFEDERDRFIRYAQSRALGPSTASLVAAAEERDIPWRRLNRYSLVQLGHGKYQQRIQATTTNRTGNIAVELAGDKEETNEILRDLGLPVPEQRIVRDQTDAKRAAKRIGFPVVLKPLAGNHGRGVSINLKTGEEVEVAFQKAREHGRSIIVESYIEGEEYAVDAVYTMEGDPIVVGAYRHPMPHNPAYLHVVYHAGAEVLADVHDQALAFFRHLGTTLDLHGMAMHGEFRLSPSGQLVPIEVNSMRVGGMGLGNMLHHTADLDAFHHFRTETVRRGCLAIKSSTSASRARRNHAQITRSVWCVRSVHPIQAAAHTAAAPAAGPATGSCGSPRTYWMLPLKSSR